MQEDIRIRRLTNKLDMYNYVRINKGSRKECRNDKIIALIVYVTQRKFFILSRDNTIGTCTLKFYDEQSCFMPGPDQEQNSSHLYRPRESESCQQTMK